MRPERIENVLRELNADVIAIQEVIDEQAECLSRRCGMWCAFGPARELLGRGYGNAVLSRFPIIDSKNHDVTVAGREPRCCLQVDLQLSADRRLCFFAVHLGTSYFERRKQASMLISQDILEQNEAKGRRILAGDFNEWTRGLTTHTLGRHLRSADLTVHLRRSRTYPGVFPFLHLDHVYYDPGFYLRSMHLHRTPASLIASDHLPLVADFESH